ncbi:MAG: hypothetical protein GY854_33175 [Deltaproteobacteria bacterium]|nr:hypothetical protein [Deltaproteobacteria bacterium]
MKGVFIAALAAILAATPACVRDEGIHDTVKNGCEKICEKLEKCEMLPSVLGSGNKEEAAANCKLRCEVTSGETRGDIENCLSGIDDAGLAWCEEDTPCLYAQGCLLELFSSAIPVVGTGDVEVGFGVGKEESCKNLNEPSQYCGSSHGLYRHADAEGELFWQCETGKCSESGKEGTDCDMAQCGTGGSGRLCDALNITDIHVFVSQRGNVMQKSPHACAAVLSGEARFQDLIPGRVRVGAKIRGTSGAGDYSFLQKACGMSCRSNDVKVDSADCLGARLDAGLCADAGVMEETLPAASQSQSWCFVVYGRDVIVEAGNTVQTAIPIPHGDKLGQVIDEILGCPDTTKQGIFLCEESPELCSDGADNDGDNNIDCADEDCVEFCNEDSAARCADLRDNDGDSLVDCQDPDCAEQESCAIPDMDAAVDPEEIGTDSTIDTGIDAGSKEGGPITP